MPEHRIEHSDALTFLRSLPDCSVDALVSDPPYGLSQHGAGDVAACLTAWLAGNEYRHGKGGFMGRTWDAWVPGPEVWREVLRVLRPGGHALVFAGTRTVDLMGVALRLSGFEIRDSLHWLYGTGFPKSHNIGKAIDKAAGAEREVVGVNPSSRPNSKRRNAGGFDGHKGLDESAGVQHVTAPATPEAAQWEGWGTALKPAHEPVIWARKPLNSVPFGAVTLNGGPWSRSATTEHAGPDDHRPIILARKPLSGTVAANVLRHGTGGLNVDGCRVATEGESFVTPQSTPSCRGGVVGADLGFSRADDEKFRAAQAASIARTQTLGRWPPNIILTHAPGCPGDKNGAGCVGGCAVGEMGAQSGEGHGDIGTAARFFPSFRYCAKASRSEREAGLDSADGKRANRHPTVKPIDLMRWLVRLVTPPGGVVLDPFTGSGTTGCAAALEGFAFLGCELDAGHADLARRRVAHWAAQAVSEGGEVTQASPAKANADPKQIPLL